MPKRGITPTLPEGYTELLAAAKDRVRRAHITAARRVNSELVLMYLELGQMILDRQAGEGWGAKVMDRLAEDLRSEFPGQRGFSRRNLHYCRQAAAIFGPAKVQQLVALLPWGHITVLIDKLDDDELRHWYAAQAVEHGWSRNVLEHHIGAQLHTRVDRSPTPAQIPVGPVESELVRDLVKDPYRLDFLDLDVGHSERQLENAMAHRMTALLAELGPGFAFVGRQVPLRVGESDFYLDLLFFHLQLRRFVVVELKTGKATPEAIGKLGFYLRVVDDQYRQQEHGDGPTIGILLTGTRDDVVVEYALGTAAGPMAAVTYQALPETLRAQLPSPETLTHAISPTTADPADQEP